MPTWEERRPARFGYSRAGKRAKLQIVFWLLCNAEGGPIAVEVVEGDTADPATLAAQVAKLKERFKVGRVVLVGDRGLLTRARIEQDLEPAGLDSLTALRAPALQAEQPLPIGEFVTQISHLRLDERERSD